MIENFKLLEAIGYAAQAVIIDNSIEDEEFDYLFSLALYYDGQYEKAAFTLVSMLENNLCKDKEVEYIDLLNKIGNVQSIKEKGNEKYSNKKYEEAIIEYTKSLEFDPKNRKLNSTILFNRALPYEKLNNKSKAIEDLNLAIKLNPYYTRG